VQINAWATAVDTLDLFEHNVVFGREVPWAFEGSRLRILPQAMCEANAFYSRQTRALHFGYFHDRHRKLIKTALSHDIVAHETAHAILDGLRPYYFESIEADALAFHEYVGDVAAMLSLFRQREFIAQLVRLPLRERSFFDQVTNLAPQVALGIYGDADRAALRTARNRKTYRTVEDEPDPHVRSQVLSGLAFEVFEGIFRRRLANWVPERQRDRELLFSELRSAARHTMRLLLRPIDFLPPGTVSFPEYASILLMVDERAFPHDGTFKYREQILEPALKKRGLDPGASDYEYMIAADLPENRLLRERDIEMIRSSRVGAYRFLDANRKLFRIPTNRDFRVVGIGTNRRENSLGTRAPPETIVQYAWEERIDLPRDVRSSAFDHLVFRAGGTLVMDENVNLVHWSPQSPGPLRREAWRGRAVALLRDRAIEVAPMRGIATDRPFLFQGDGAGALRLMANTARLHRGRGG
jgi:hypothetical protein